MKLHPKPVELIEAPLDGQVQAQTVNAPTAPTEIYLYQVVRLASGVAQPVQTTQTTGFYLAVTDTSVGKPVGSFVDNPGASWFASRPSTVDVVGLSGKLGIISAKGVLASGNIGASFGLTQEGRNTVLDLSNTATAAATIQQVVEGAVGDEYARVLVRFN